MELFSGILENYAQAEKRENAKQDANAIFEQIEKYVDTILRIIEKNYNNAIAFY